MSPVNTQERQRQIEEARRLAAKAKLIGDVGPALTPKPKPTPPSVERGRTAPEPKPKPTPPSIEGGPTAPVRIEAELGEGPPPPPTPTPTKPDRPGGQIATVDGKKHYIKGSTMYEMGFRNPEEYRITQRAGVTHGVHEGKLVPEGSVLVTVRGIEQNKDTVVRYSGEKTSTHPELSRAVMTGLRKGKYRIPITIEGKTTFLTPQQAKKLDSLSGEAQLEFAIKLGLIPEGSATNQAKLQRAWASQTQSIENLEKAYLIPSFESKNIKLPDGYWVAIEDWNKLDKGYQTIGLRQGFEAMNNAMGQDAKDFRETYTLLPDDSWMKNSDLMKLKVSSPELHKILSEKGYDTYTKAIDDAKDSLEPYYDAGKNTYDVAKALLTRKPELEKAIDLLFDQKDIEKIKYEKMPGLTIGKKDKKQAALKTIGMLAIAAPIVTGTPVPFDDIVFYAALTGLAVYGGVKVNEIINEFKDKTGRTPGPADIVAVDKQGNATTALELMPQLQRIPALTPPPITTKPEVLVPPEVQYKLEEMKWVELPKYEEGVKGKAQEVVFLPTPMISLSDLTKLKAGLLKSTADLTASEEGIKKALPKTKTIEINWDKMLDEAREKQRKEDIKLAFELLGSELALEPKDAHFYRKAWQDYLTRWAIWQVARKQYIEALNPQPIKGSATKESLASYSELVIGKISDDADIDEMARSATANSIAELNKALSQDKTAIQAINATMTATQALVSQKIKQITGTKSLTQTQQKALAQSVTKAAVKTAINEVAATRALTAAATAELADALTRITPIPPMPPRFTLPKGIGKKKKWTPEEIKSAIAWKEGFTIHALKYPYRRGIDEASFNVNNVPEGLDVLNISGPGSAQASAKSKGQLPKKLTVDVGNQDVIITPLRGKRVRLRHQRDTKNSISMLTIKRGHPISKKRGRIFHTPTSGGTVLSHLPLRGY